MRHRDDIAARLSAPRSKECDETAELFRGMLAHAKTRSRVLRCAEMSLAAFDKDGMPQGVTVRNAAYYWREGI